MFYHSVNLAHKVGKLSIFVWAMVGRLWKIGTSFYCPSFPSPFYLYFTIFLLFFCGWRLLHLDTFAIVAWEYFFIRCYSCSICFCVPPLFGPSFVDFYSRYSPIFLYFFYAFSVLVLHFLFMVSAAKYFSIRRITKVPSVRAASGQKLCGWFLWLCLASQFNE